MPEILLDEARHEYTADGRKVLGVTQALSLGGVCSWSVRRDSPEVQQALQLGSATALATQYDDEARLNERTLDPRVLGPLTGWRRFKRESGFIITSVETKHYHERYGYAGRVDRLGILRGRPGVLDIKTGEEYDWHPIQLAGYALIVGEPLPEAFGRWDLYLRPDGTYKLVEHTQRVDFDVFKAALVVAKWKWRRSNARNQPALAGA